MLEIGRLKQRKIPGIMVQGFSRILSSTMKSFWKKNILARDLILIDFRDVTREFRKVLDARPGGQMAGGNGSPDAKPTPKRIKVRKCPDEFPGE